MKGQSSSEFFLVLAALLLIYTVMIFLYNNWVVNLEQTRINLQTTDAASRLAAAINFIHLAGEGTNYYFHMAAPNSNISILDNVVEARSNASPSTWQSEILTNRTNITIIRNSGTINITNAGGVIAIN